MQQQLEGQALVPSRSPTLWWERALESKFSKNFSFGRRQFWSLQLSGLAQVASSRLKLQLAGGFMLRGGRATTLALLSSDAGRARAVARTGSFWGHDMPQPAPNRPVHLVSGLEPSLRLAGPRKSSGQKHSHEQVHWIW